MMTRTLPRGSRITALLALLALLFGLIAQGAIPAHAQDGPLTWRHVGAVGAAPCVDSTEPDVLLWQEGESIVRFNWSTGARQVFHDGPLTLCAPNGLIFSSHADGSHWRMTLRDPSPRRVARVPTHVGNDGTLLVYAHEGARLYVSADGGLSWVERATQFAGSVESVAVANADSRAIYIVVITPEEREKMFSEAGGHYTIYFSPDAGVSWEQRFQETRRASAWSSDVLVSVWPIAGHASPVDVLGMSFAVGTTPSGHGRILNLSADGGRSFNYIGGINFHYAWDIKLAYSQGWVIMYASGPASTIHFGRTNDGGKSWQLLTLPVSGYSGEVPLKLFASSHGPLGVFLVHGFNASGTPSLWYSADAGASWPALTTEEVGQLLVTPYLPASLLRIRKGQLYVASFGDEGRARVAGAPRSGAPGSIFFPETQHNLGGPFKAYWEQHGGLAQFGYPKTEPFRELNPADGKVYLVQYVERNRLEYHPELAGTQYEVLLGLLGSQFTAGRQGEAPFQRVGGPQVAGERFFPETGHTLGGSFRPYWETHGGLAMYGYPISQEFFELNEDDGRTYIVQYFERARFEWHPENKDTPYEVLLGLLGNKLLRQKGWS